MVSCVIVSFVSLNYILKLIISFVLSIIVFAGAKAVARRFEGDIRPPYIKMD